MSRAIDLHSRIDELFSALEQRPDRDEDYTADAGPLGVERVTETHEGNDQAFTIFMVGDSTMRVRRPAFDFDNTV